ncbi:uncharacterized protein LOC122390458 isoform X2 [Amphibalanus amphitrite]|nr:uncharacterized protein LOC122388225 isoform X2 [Amphibalanus amphitrite]XP_043239344.1 uncharacterized protein LOC122390458 isoform X2 [Amphibalanus amphitrite]
MVDTPGHIAIPSDDEWRPLNDQLFASLRPAETPFDLFNSLSPRCEDMIASCFIYGSRINSSECCQDVFSDDYFVYYQSRCITTLRSRRLTALNQTRPGDYNGIGVILKDDRETFFAERDMRFSLVPAQEGNRIILTPHYILPMESVIEQTFIATVGAVTRLSVTHTVVDRTGEFTGLLPFSEKTCTDIPPHGSKTPPLSCRGALYNSEMRRVCGCQHAITLRNGDDPRKVNVCEPLDMFACQRDWQAPGHQITKVDCPHQCQKIIYDVVSDGSPIKRPMLDNEAFFGGSPVPVDTEHNSTFSVVMVFYPSLVSRVIQLSKATLMDWLSAFGGQLSLFIGASVITMLEMVFFIVRIVAVCTGGLTERCFGTPRVGCLTDQ